MLIQELDLRRPIFSKTAAYGHFGRELPEFSWEKTPHADKLRDIAKSGNGVAVSNGNGNGKKKPAPVAVKTPGKSKSSSVARA